MIVLALETSCDETAAAVVDVKARKILSNVLFSQIEPHKVYGGVVPELSSRAHLERLPVIVSQALTEANLPSTQLDAISATTGPGLTTALLMGSTFAKTMAVSLNKPFLATNHIEGHALSPHLTDPTLEFPYLLLLVSGGHSQIVMVNNIGNYELLGTSVDDAAGECFDKIGRLLGMSHPCGPKIETLAKEGTPTVLLPFPLNDGSLNFSFSGLKTAARNALATTSHPPDLAASLQAKIAEIFVKKCRIALEHTHAPTLVAAGGVAANTAIRTALAEMCVHKGVRFSAPPPSLCTDNAAMIAYAAGLRHLNKLDTGNLSTPVRPRWPLTKPNSLM
ncbi:MAG: tRNA (adenosine(37)-N6)-threonylcarbamoyltransferase complex transferase subunit TsaD [Alphaproteobacteria bacterium]